MKKFNIKEILRAALLIGLGTVLSLIQINGVWINGGSVTLLSMLPVCIFAYIHGVKKGIIAGFVYGVLQYIVGMNSLKGITLTSFFMALILDYLLAFSFLGFAGLFKNMKNKSLGFSLGCILAIFLRFICHFLSGIFIWGSLLEGGMSVVLYSLTYNTSYILPEMLTTAIAAYLIASKLKV